MAYDCPAPLTEAEKTEVFIIILSFIGLMVVFLGLGGLI
jgi:hypothetical protein